MASSRQNLQSTSRPETCSSLPLFHHFSEVPEQVVRVVGAGAGLGVVSPGMAKLQLVCLAAKSQADQLVAQADAKHRPASDKLADILLGVGYRLRIARAV